MTTPAGTVTEMLAAVRNGDGGALERLWPLVYDELRRIARRRLREERGDHTLEPTALVHEAYLRLAADEAPRWENRAHFVAVAARAMRRILVDHARARLTRKRSGAAATVALDELFHAPRARHAELIALDDALQALAIRDPQLARLVELKFFGGLTIDEMAAALGVSPATVEREWAGARAWLRSELAPERSAR